MAYKGILRLDYLSNFRLPQIFWRCFFSCCLVEINCSLSEILHEQDEDIAALISVVINEAGNSW